MAVVVPTSIVRPTGIQRVGVITAAQTGAIVETDAFIRSRLRVLASFGGEDLTTTSLTYVTLTEDRPIRSSFSASGTLDVVHYGTNVTVRVQVTDGSTTVSSVVTIVGGPGVGTSTLTVTSLTGNNWRMAVSILVPISGTATHSGTLVQETAHDATTIA